MSYRATRKAEQDILEIYVRGVLDFGVVQAEQYYNGLIAAFELLADNPHIARDRLEFDPPVRIHRYRSHLIVYVLQERDILIVRVLHGRQGWENHL